MTQSQSPRRSEAVDTATQPAEPWESWETRLCLWSLGIGVSALLVLGLLVNIFLL